MIAWQVYGINYLYNALVSIKDMTTDMEAFAAVACLVLVSIGALIVVVGAPGPVLRTRKSTTRAMANAGLLVAVVGMQVLGAALWRYASFKPVLDAGGLGFMDFWTGGDLAAVLGGLIAVACGIAATWYRMGVRHGRSA